MSLQQMLQQFGGGSGGAPGGGADLPVADTAETIQISSMALLKMLKHGRLGIPMEVMGLMLGEFVDEYTVTCVDVFAMPQHGTGVSVEAVDPVFQTNMLDMLKQCGRPEMVVGWYHSHRKFKKKTKIQYSPLLPVVCSYFTTTDLMFIRFLCTLCGV